MVLGCEKLQPNTAMLQVRFIGQAAMKLEGKIKPFTIGAAIGAITGYVLSGFLMYYGAILLFLFIRKADAEENIPKKIIWWGFIAGMSASAIFTWIFIFPMYSQ